MSYCSHSRRRRFTVLDFQSRAFNCIYGHFQQHFTQHAQKWLFMNFQSKFRYHSLIPRPRFPCRVQNFGDLAMFSIDFRILYAKSLPHFYFRFIWSTDLESIPHVDPHGDNFHQAWSWQDHPQPSYSVIAADTLRDLVTATFWPWTAVVHGGSHDQPCHQVGRFIVELWVITFSTGHHWKWVRGHCALAKSHDSWVRGQKQLHFWNHWLQFVYSLCNFGGSTMKVIQVICQNNAWPCVKSSRPISFCACAKSRDLLKVP